MIYRNLDTKDDILIEKSKDVSAIQPDVEIRFKLDQGEDFKGIVTKRVIKKYVDNEGKSIDELIVYLKEC